MTTNTQNKIHKKSVIGKFILDSISIGMYNDPLMLFREYIQNSTDALDEIFNDGEISKSTSKINISIDGAGRIISIRDNGCGVKANKAWSVLHDIGRSPKKANVNRGFRGIGRLGGLAYCDRLRFVTKAKGEKTYSTSAWDCNKLRKLINEETDPQDAERVIKNVVKFSQERFKGSINEHFFLVEMENVKSSRNVLLNVPTVKAYIAQVAPVPFHSTKFRYAKTIEDRLLERVPSHATYNIYVNGEQIFKPYTNSVSIYKNVQEEIKSINFVDLTYDGETLGFGWIAELDLLGIIHSSHFVDGVRIRSGNILVGDKSLLSGLFRERRFNNYLIGEVHATSNKLVLNSRRDDFEDNNYKEAFYCSFAKEIGLPFSQRIREASTARSMQKNQHQQSNLLGMAEKIHKNGHISEIQKKRVIIELKQIKTKNSSSLQSDKINSLINKVANSDHFLKQNHKRIPRNFKFKLQLIFDIIFKKSSNKKEAEEIINTILKKID